MGVAKVVSINRECPPKKAVELIDEFGRLSDELKAFAPKAKRHEQLRKQILGWFGQIGEAESKEVPGDAFVLRISERAKETKIRSTSKVFERLGKALAMELCQFSVRDVKKHLPEAEHAKYLIEANCGTRRIEVQRRAKAA